MKASTKWFNAQKGYGFITDLDSKEDVFVHQSNIVMDGFRYLNEDDIILNLTEQNLTMLCSAVKDFNAIKRH